VLISLYYSYTHNFIGGQNLAANSAIGGGLGVNF